MISLDLIFIIIAALLILSILASKLSVQMGVPALVLFIAIGMAIGSEGFGGIAFDDPALTQSIGVTALVFILFSGGLDTGWEKVRPILKEGLLLATLGVAITSVAMAWFANTFLGFGWAEGLLLGATVASTDAAAVFAVLRGKNINLKGSLAPILELESGSNDPMAIFLTLGLIDWISHPETQILALLGQFAWEMVVGLIAGLLFAQAIVWVINHIRLEYEGLYPVLTLGAVLLCFGFTSEIHGSGFLAVYVLGVMMGRREFIHKNSLIKFHDGLAWLMQIGMFLTLGLQVFPSRLVSIAGTGTLVAAFLMFIARPLSVFIALLPTRLNWREKLFLAWVGLRGAAPIILATFSLLANIALPLPIFDLVFFVVLASVLLQGTSLVPLARWLGLFSEETQHPSLIDTLRESNKLNEHLVELSIPKDSETVGKQVLDLGLPEGTLLVLLNRQGNILVPNGGTRMEADDELVLLVPKTDQATVRNLFGA
jgi:potassium/hydrogen antiporter